MRDLDKVQGSICVSKTCPHSSAFSDEVLPSLSSPLLLLQLSHGFYYVSDMLTSQEFQEVKEEANIILENPPPFLTYLTGLGALGEGYRRPGRDKLHQVCFKR